MNAAKCPSCHHNETDHDGGQCWAEDERYDFYTQHCACALTTTDHDVTEQLRNTGGIA